MWTHKYKYLLKSESYTQRVGFDHSGEIQVDCAMTDKQAESFVRSMDDTTPSDAVMIKCELIEERA